MKPPAQDAPDHSAPSPDLVGALSAHLGRQLTPREFSLPGGGRVAVDGADGDPPEVIVQCTRVRGQLKSSHRNKIIADAFKLMWLRDSAFPRARALLAVSPECSRLFSPDAWLTIALRHSRITVVVPTEGGITTPIPLRDHSFTGG
ncbi:hypothetical protein [Nocardiopsis ganjiahuensis]|uniref:hypothetical protein n=1 Tax=Nocardiopsis ganjiahuensis TaxID=239984 RepID=UPI000348D214|nr:hypothetical protein [Nocardiopsis ganjiahuensis]